MPTSVRLSVVIITFNEEKNIRRCLESVQPVADEIVVVDSFSTDKTKEICLEYGVRFVQHPFGGYAEQKNFALAQASYPHILSLDADEALSEELKKGILFLKSNWNADAYKINRLTNYCGHWIKHTDWYPDRKFRLFDREKAYWGGSGMLHEEVVLKPGAKPGFVKGDILHYSFYSISQHLQQLDRFTGIGAKDAFEQGRNASLLIILFSPIFKFIKSYFIRLGFLDGYYGFVVCAISAFASFIKYTKLRELRRQHAVSP